MRRIVLFSFALAALAVPAGALAFRASPGDGTLVVHNGQAPKGMPVVQLQISGSVVGQVTGFGRIIIDGGLHSPNAEVNGAGAAHDVSPKDTAQWWSGDTFKFRAVGGTYTIVIYGSDVDLFAVGTGTVQLAGMPDTPAGDGWFSLNGGDRRSLPPTISKQLSIVDSSNG